MNSRTEPIATGSFKEMDEMRDDLRERMAERGLYPELLVGLVTTRAGDRNQKWGVFYAPPEKEEEPG